MISYSHDTSLVLAAIVVSIVAAFTSLALTNNISRWSDNKRKALIVMASFVLGSGIWSMHFVAMLAHQFSIPIYYDILQTLSSALVAILVVGIALLLLHFTSRTSLVLTVAGCILGVGVLLMHYIGMLGIRGAVPVFSESSKVLAGIVACVMGAAAIQVAYGRRSRQNILMGSVVMGFSVVAVHYAAMHGTHFEPTSNPVPPDSVVLASGTLAVVVTLAVFVICGSFLLAATTFLTSPDPVAVAGGAADTRQLQQPAVPGPASATTRQERQAAIQAAAGTEQRTQPGPPSLPAVEIPFEKDKKIGFAPSDDVAAIRADGHYTHLYTRHGTRFCPWSITEAENQLSDAGFHRTHRSYLVNVRAVAGFEKRKETGICRFDDIPQLATVPVSRNRIVALTSVLDITTS